MPQEELGTGGGSPQSPTGLLLILQGGHVCNGVPHLKKPQHLRNAASLGSRDFTEIG